MTRLANELNQAPQEPAINFEQGQWIATPGKVGQAVDVDATLAQISADPMGVFFKSHVLSDNEYRLTRRSPISLLMVEKLQASIQKPFLIKVYDPIQDETLDWSISPEALASWVVVSEPTSREPVIRLDPARLTAYLQKKAASLAPMRTLEPYQPPSDLTNFWQEGKTLQLMARHLPTTYTVAAGDTLWNIARKVQVQYWMILKANPGVSDAALRTGQVLQIPSKNDMLPLPVVMGKRIVVSISQQHMWTYENGQSSQRVCHQHRNIQFTDHARRLPGAKPYRKCLCGELGLVDAEFPGHLPGSSRFLERHSRLAGHVEWRAPVGECPRTANHLWLYPDGS